MGRDKGSEGAVSDKVVREGLFCGRRKRDLNEVKERNMQLTGARTF